MSRDPKLFLDDIRESTSRILRYTHGLSYADFVADDKTVDAVLALYPHSNSRRHLLKNNESHKCAKFRGLRVFP